MRLTCPLVTAFLAMASPSAAGQCPSLMEQIDEATLSYDQQNEFNVTEVKKHRMAGEVAHLAGDHSKAQLELQALILMGANS